MWLMLPPSRKNTKVARDEAFCAIRSVRRGGRSRPRCAAAVRRRRRRTRTDEQTTAIETALGRVTAGDTACRRRLIARNRMSFRLDVDAQRAAIEARVGVRAPQAQSSRTIRNRALRARARYARSRRARRHEAGFQLQAAKSARIESATTETAGPDRACAARRAASSSLGTSAYRDLRGRRSSANSRDRRAVARAAPSRRSICASV